MNLHDIELRFVDRLFAAPRAIDTDPPSDRLELYTQLIVGVNHGLLDHVFQPSFDQLEEAGLADRIRLVREFLSESPPRSHSARELAERFVAWLELRHPEFFERLPGLRRLMGDQRIAQEVMYAADEGKRALDAEAIEGLGQLSVDELRASQIEP